jgi:hypothetical protein
LSEIKTYVLLYDLHCPVHDKPSVNAVFDYIEQNKQSIDGVILGGDALDCSSVSHHNSSKPGLRPRGQMKRDLDDFDEDILARLENTLRPDAERVYICGNHEAWLQDQLFETNPELEGLISIDSYLRLEQRGWQWIPQGGHHKLGHLYVCHGDTLGGGMHCAKKAVDTWGENVVLGHHHVAQMFCKASPVHVKKRFAATVIPCLSTTNPHYARNKANSHVNGFGIAEVRENGDFNLFILIISDGVFSYGGKVYGQRKAVCKPAAKAKLMQYANGRKRNKKGQFVRVKK